MSKYQQYKIKPEQFLTIACNILYKSLVDSARADAKNIYRAISEGKRVSLIDVRMQDDADVRFDLVLDHSEYRGERLNFKSFRNSVSGLVGSVSENLRNENTVPVFTEQNDGSMLFGVPGVTRAGDQINIMMLGVNLRGAGSVLLKLQYIDPSQFEVDGQQVG